MKRLQRLLLDGFDRHGLDAATPVGFEQGLSIRAVGLVSPLRKVGHTVPQQRTPSSLA
jgi:hypothetical protein